MAEISKVNQFVNERYRFNLFVMKLGMFSDLEDDWDWLNFDMDSFFVSIGV